MRLTTAELRTLLEDDTGDNFDAIHFALAEEVVELRSQIKEYKTRTQNLCSESVDDAVKNRKKLRKINVLCTNVIIWERLHGDEDSAISALMVDLQNILDDDA